MVETTDGHEGYEHAAIGAVHEVIIHRTTPETLEAALHHEGAVCHSPRVVVDLSRLPDITDEHVALLVSALADHEEQWTFRISDDTPQAVVDRLSRAGLEGHLITDASDDMPVQVEHRDTG